MNEKQELISRMANTVISDVDALLSVIAVLEKGDGGVTRERLEEVLEKDTRELKAELAAAGEKFDTACDTFELLSKAEKFIRRRKLEKGGKR